MKKKIMSVACAAFVGFSIAGASLSVSNADEIEKTSGSVKLLQDDYQRTQVNVGGGVWSYGTNTESHPGEKYVWSNYTHPDKTHGSSATLGKKTNSSCAVKGKTSYASIVGPKHHTGKANWNTSCTP